MDSKISPEEKQLYQHIADLAGWNIAKHYNCGYSGDSDPIQHGGFFYDVRDWEKYGYANCVELWMDPESEDVLHVQTGTINKPYRPEDMESCWQSMEIDSDDEIRSNINAQIEVVRSSWGIEPDGTKYPCVKTFRLAEWAEWRIWRSVAGWLTSLGEQLVIDEYKGFDLHYTKFRGQHRIRAYNQLDYFKDDVCHTCFYEWYNSYNDALAAIKSAIDYAVNKNPLKP